MKWKDIKIRETHSFTRKELVGDDGRRYACIDHNKNRATREFSLIPRPEYEFAVYGGNGAFGMLMDFPDTVHTEEEMEAYVALMVRMQ